MGYEASLTIEPTKAPPPKGGGRYSHIVDSFLPIACCRLQSSILLKIRPPEELLHQTCRTFRGESDSSTPEVSGGLLVVVFEASRQTAKSAA